MSYCRISDDSDLYAYHHVNGTYILNIAGVRYKPGVNFNKISFDAIIERYNDYFDPIGLPLDDTNYAFNTLVELRDKIQEALEMGYRSRPGLIYDISKDIENA